ncbi:hypothetical protein CYLTODRAFT_319922, partial [Cylindrobasidium torrendii FP15055 ss-10]
MPAAYSADLKRLIYDWYVEDITMTYRKAAARAKVSIGLVAKIMKNMDEFGVVVNPNKRRTGRALDYDEGDLAYLTEWLQCHPTAYLDEAREALCEAREVE